MVTSKDDAMQLGIFRILRRLGIGLACFFIAASVILSLTESWLFKTWEALSPDEILFHLQAPLAGTNSNMIYDYLRTYGAVEAISLIIVFATLFVLRKRKDLFHSAMRLFLIVAVGMLGSAVWDFSEQIKLAANKKGSSSGGKQRRL